MVIQRKIFASGGSLSCLVVTSALEPESRVVCDGMTGTVTLDCMAAAVVSDVSSSLAVLIHLCPTQTYVSYSI